MGNRNLTCTGRLEKKPLVREETRGLVKSLCLKGSYRVENEPNAYGWPASVKNGGKLGGLDNAGTMQRGSQDVG